MTAVTSNQNINRIPINPELNDVLQVFRKSIDLDFNCHHVGIIEEFFPDDQTATVSINYTKTFLQVDDKGVQSTGVLKYPLLTTVPCIVLGGGLGYLTFPIKPHDECLVLFNDRDLDNWFAGGLASPPNTARKHSLMDGIALVGVRNQDCLIENYSTNSVDLRYYTNKIRIYTDKVIVQLGDSVNLTLYNTGKFEVTNATGELMTILKQLLIDIQSATTNTIFGAQPLIMPDFAASLAKFESFVS